MRRGLAGILAMPLAIIVVLFGSLPARAQMDSREAIALQNQILELRHEVQMLRDQQGQGRGGSALGGRYNVPPPPQTAAPVAGGDVAAALLERVGRLEEDVRALHGQIDEMNNAIQQQNLDLGKRIDDLNFKLDNGAGSAAAGPPSAPPPQRSPTMSPPAGNLGAPAAPPAAAVIAPPPVRRTPELAMQQGSAALARRDYAAAEAAAREVLAVPRSPRAVDAQFLLAQALNGKKDYQGAAVAYDDSYNRARTGAHAQDSLLGLASTLVTLGDKRSACAALDKMKAEFPATRQDLREPVAATRQRAGCR